MTALRFDFRDLLKSNRIALSVQRIWIQFIGLLVGYSVYLVITYLSFVVSGHNLGAMWSQMGLFPCLARVDSNWISWIIYLVGVIFLLFVYLLTSTAIARATYMLFKGNNFYTWREAFVFSFKKAWSILFSPIAVIVIIALIVGGGAIFALLGRIPYVGELGISIFYLLLLIIGLLTVIVMLALAVALIYTPAVIATTDDDAFEAVFQSFSLLWNQPWRLISYSLLVVVLTCLSFLGASFFLKNSIHVVDMVFSTVTGDKFINLVGQAYYLSSSWVTDSLTWMRSLLGEFSSLFYFSNEYIQINLPSVLNISAHILSLMLVLMGAFVISYMLATFNVGNTITYLVLRRRNDGENLLERTDREEMAEEPGDIITDNN